MFLPCFPPIAVPDVLCDLCIHLLLSAVVFRPLMLFIAPLGVFLAFAMTADLAKIASLTRTGLIMLWYHLPLLPKPLLPLSVIGRLSTSTSSVSGIGRMTTWAILLPLG